MHIAAEIVMILTISGRFHILHPGVAAKTLYTIRNCEEINFQIILRINGKFIFEQFLVFKRLTNLSECGIIYGVGSDDSGTAKERE